MLAADGSAPNTDMSLAIRNVLALFALCATGLTSCTLLSDFAVDECATSADCELLSGEIRRCEQARCVPGCSDNAHCAAVDPRFPLCPQVGGQCVALADVSEDCSATVGYDEQELSTLTLQGVDVIGAFASTPRSSTWLSLELAANEWNQARKASPSTALRPLIVLLCNDSSASVSRAMPHLVQELGAQALVAPGDSSALRAALDPIATAPVFSLSPVGSSLSPEGLESEGDLLWYLGSEYLGTLPAYEQLLERAIATARSRAPVPADFHIALVIGADSEDDALASAVERLIQVEGRDADGLIIDDRLRVVRAPQELRFDPTQGLERLLNPTPDLVLLFMGPREDPTALDASILVDVLEAQVKVHGAAPPLYLVGPRSLQAPALQELVAARPSLRSRVAGVRADPVPDGQLSEALQQRFAAAYPALRPRAPQRKQGDRALEPVYDALYSLAYALSAGRQATPEEAPGVLAGFRRITDAAASESIAIGPGLEQLEQAMQLLESGATLRLEGTSGAVRFDPGTHTRTGAPRAYVLGPDGRLLDIDPSTVFDSASLLPD